MLFNRRWNSNSCNSCGWTTYPPTTKLDNTEFYDGTSWSEQNTMNTARNGGGGWGSQTAMVVGGGSTPSVTGANRIMGWNKLVY